MTGQVIVHPAAKPGGNRVSRSGPASLGSAWYHHGGGDSSRNTSVPSRSLTPVRSSAASPA